MLVALDLNESASVFEGAPANANRQPLMNLYMEQLLLHFLPKQATLPPLAQPWEAA
jgi:hypothetical protein